MRYESAARAIIDALGLQVEPTQLAVLMNRANRAYSMGNFDDYHNQCDFIKALVHGEKEGQQ